MTDGSGGNVDLGIPGIGPAELVGRGGFGLVYRATQLGSGGLVAVKVLQDHLDETAALRFRREVRALGALRGHPNICTVYDAGFGPGGRPYLIMEYAPSSLAQHIEHHGALPWRDAVDLAARLAGALEAAHQAGLLHRDVKPENVLRTRFDDWRLADFGLVRRTDDTLSRSLTATVAHAAPELLEGASATVASDLYALGSTVFVGLTGRSAFGWNDDAHPVSIYRRIAEEPVPEMPGVPASVAAVVRTAMAKSPEDRFPTAAAMGEALLAAQADPGPGSGQVTTAPETEQVDARETVDVRSPQRPADRTEAVHRGARDVPRDEIPPVVTARGHGRRPLVLAVGLLAVVAVIGGIVSLVAGDRDGTEGGTATMTNARDVGLSDAARQRPYQWVSSQLVVDECTGAEGGPCPDQGFAAEECVEPDGRSCSDLTDFEVYFSTDCPADPSEPCEIGLLDLPKVPLEFNGEYGSAEVIGESPSGGLLMEFVDCDDQQVVHSVEFTVDGTQRRNDERLATRLTGRLFVYHPDEKWCASSYDFSFVMEERFP